MSDLIPCPECHHENTHIQYCAICGHCWEPESQWRNFATERPEDGQMVVLYWQSTVEDEECEIAFYEATYESFSLGDRSIPPGNSLIKCVFWQPVRWPMPAEIEAAMKGDQL